MFWFNPLYSAVTQYIMILVTVFGPLVGMAHALWRARAVSALVWASVWFASLYANFATTALLPFLLGTGDIDAGVHTALGVIAMALLAIAAAVALWRTLRLRRWRQEAAPQS